MVNATKPTEKERGQALIEFAFIVPFLLALLLLILDFGVAIDRRQVIQHAVREGARQGAIGAGEAQIRTIVSEQSQGVLEPNNVDVPIVCYVDSDGDPTSNPTAGSSVRVGASYDYQLFFGVELLDWFGVTDDDDFTITLDPDAEARMETSLAGVTPCP